MLHEATEVVMLEKELETMEAKTEVSYILMTRLATKWEKVFCEIYKDRLALIVTSSLFGSALSVNRLLIS